MDIQQCYPLFWYKYNDWLSTALISAVTRTVCNWTVVHIINYALVVLESSLFLELLKEQQKNQKKWAD